MPHPLKLILLCCGWLLAWPLLLSWGVGVSDGVLDRLSVPGALVAGLPARLGLAGWVGVLALALGVGRRPGRSSSGGLLVVLAEVVCSWGALALLASAVATARPLIWIVGLAAFAAVVPFSGAEGDEAEVPKPGLPLPAERLALVLGALAWGASTRVRPYGPGLLPPAWEDGVASLLSSLPSSGVEGFFVLFLGVVAVVLSRRRRPWLRGAVFCAVAAALLDPFFGGSGSHLVSAAALGALLGAWPLPMAGLLVRPLRPALLLVVACAVIQLRPALLERWHCGASIDQDGLRFLRDDGDLSSLGIVPDNMPFLVVIAEGGRSLERLAPSGVVSVSRPLSPEGGRIVSPPPGTHVFARVVSTASSDLRVEWWDTAELRLLTAREVTGSCGAEDGLIEPGSHRLLLACRDSGDLLIVDPRPSAAPERLAAGAVVGSVMPLGGGLLVGRMGPFARAEVRALSGSKLASVPLGPGSAGLVMAGSLLAVARGPAGQVEVRGNPPGDGGRAPVLVDTAEGAQAALGQVLDTVRVGRWPGRLSALGDEPAAYVTSKVDARATRLDLEVTWHQRSVALGAPPRQVVVDVASQTLYGVNRCGLFELRIPSTFPWSAPRTPAPSVPPAPPPPSP